ncbi:GNAT family N-acetyltransferase [Rathayibacter sp. YIM 133350]|uniref:GNAT family N-acetyltransferase n=1 Tax=Rathayibacter sp. YIM 133350 TaxID=3131992 RepID=UPI00307D19F5
MTETSVRILAVSDAPWADVERIFGTRGDPSTCWCQFFKVPPSDWKTKKPLEFKEMLQEQVLTRQPPPAVVAYLDDEPVGWCAIEPRDHYPRVLNSQVGSASDQPTGDPAIWAVTCFVVRVGFRRKGVGRALLEGAVRQARESGARVIEGYPIDPVEKKFSSADLYHGTLSQFLGAGFEVVSRPSPNRALVQLAL